MTEAASDAPVASVVIRARDEAAALGAVLEGVLDQEGVGPFEVLVIDSGSTDGTVDVARRFPVRIHEIPAASFSFGGALNLGARLARGAVCVHLSAHCRPASRGWLRALLAPLAAPDVVAAFGRQRPVPGVNPYEELDLERIFPPHPLAAGARAYFSNANCAIRRDALLARPFDEDIAIMEDALWLLELPAGERVVYAPEAGVFHSHPLRWRYWHERYARDGLAYRYIGARLGHDLVPGRALRLGPRLVGLAVELVRQGRILAARGYYRHLLAFPLYGLLRESGLRRGLREGARRHPAPARRVGARTPDTAGAPRRAAPPPLPGPPAGARSPERRAPEGHRGPRVAAVVVNYGTLAPTLRAVRSVRASERPVSEVIVVDNGSADGSLTGLRAALGEDAVVATGRNLGFSGGVNVGIARALDGGADLILLVNSDAVLEPGCLGRLEAALAADRGAGIAGPALVAWMDPGRVTSLGMEFRPVSGRMRHAGFGRRRDALGGPAIRRVDGVSGCVMLVRRAVFARIGVFAEEYFFSFEDLDFCLRARAAGFATVCATEAVARHEGSRSIGARSARRLYFATRNHLLLAQRAAPAPGRLGGLARGGAILALNLAHALVRSEAPLGPAIGGVIRGARDHARGRYGDGS